MIIYRTKRLASYRAQQYPKYIAEIYCISSDTKPISAMAEGSKLTEADTGDFYLFDGTNWIKQVR